MSSAREINQGSSQLLTGRDRRLRWQCWPLRDDALRSAGLIAALALLGLLMRWLTGQSHTALLAAGFLGVTMWRFFVPITYELSDSGLERRILRRRSRIAWRSIRRWEAGPDGVLLMPEREDGLSGWCRAIYVPWGPHAQEVLARLRAHRPHAEARSRAPAAGPHAPEQPSAADHAAAGQPRTANDSAPGQPDAADDSAAGSPPAGVDEPATQQTPAE